MAKNPASEDDRDFGHAFFVARRKPRAPECGAFGHVATTSHTCVRARNIDVEYVPLPQKASHTTAASDVANVDDTKIMLNDSKESKKREREEAENQPETPVKRKRGRPLSAATKARRAREDAERKAQGLNYDESSELDSDNGTEHDGLQNSSGLMRSNNIPAGAQTFFAKDLDAVASDGQNSGLDKLCKSTKTGNTKFLNEGLSAVRAAGRDFLADFDVRKLAREIGRYFDIEKLTKADLEEAVGAQVIGRQTWWQIYGVCLEESRVAKFNYLMKEISHDAYTKLETEEKQKKADEQELNRAQLEAAARELTKLAELSNVNGAKVKEIGQELANEKIEKEKREQSIKEAEKLAEKAHLDVLEIKRINEAKSAKLESQSAQLEDLIKSTNALNAQMKSVQALIESIVK